MGKTKTSTYHHGNLRAELLARAEEALREHGSQRLSLRELARDIGVSHGAPRRHFADRQALLNALAEEGFGRLGRELHDAVEGAGGAFNARLEALARAYVQFATRDPALLELMFARKHEPGAEALSEAAALAFAPPLELISEGQAAGELEPGDPERVATLLFATVQGLLAMANTGVLAGEDLDAVVTDAVERMLAGLRPR